MKKDISLYPMKFEPILKEKVWGGDKLNRILGKACGDGIGESWEISGVENNISIIANGALKNTSLTDLLENYGRRVLGNRVFDIYGTVFPLLFKFIDARENLSVQVHPDDNLAHSRHNSFGKTELWYILDSDPGAELIVGFNQEIDEAIFKTSIQNKNIIDYLNREKVTAGDAYVILPGTIHAIGGGIMLAEIQQTSDITYRVYDWDRPDRDGKMRTLHIDQAVEAMSYSPITEKRNAAQQPNTAVTVGQTPFFKVNEWIVTKALERDLTFSDSFKVYMCLKGAATLECDGKKEEIVKGETVLIPAEFTSLKINTTDAVFLEVYIP